MYAKTTKTVIFFWSRSLLLLLTATVHVMAFVSCSSEPGCYTRDILEIWKRFRKSDMFDADSIWARMDACFQRKSTADVDLWELSDRFWQGFVYYGVKGSLNGSDPWKAMDIFLENDPAPFMDPQDLQDFPYIDPGAPDIIIYEPCNSVSNLAYIRTMLEICEYDQENQWFLDDTTVTGLVRAFDFQTPGSALFHASGTWMGGYLDTEGSRLFALLMLQGMLRTIPYDPRLYDLRPTPRPYTGPNASETACRVIINDPVEQWYPKISALKTEDFFVSFAAIANTILNLIFPEDIALRLSRIIGNLLLGSTSNGSVLEYILTEFHPVLIQAYKDNGVSPTLMTRVKLLFQTVGAVFIKMMYAFYWQEQILPGKHLVTPEANFIGAYMTGVVNKLANTMTGFKRAQTDRDFQNSHHVYPGDWLCSIQQPHSKWHEVSANALVDLTFLADSISRVIGGEQLQLEGESELLDCYMAPGAFSDEETATWSALMEDSSAVLETCFSGFLEDWRTPNVGDFLSCMFTSFATAAHGTEIPKSLDSCLIENQCIAFDGTSLDLPRLLKCVGLNSLFQIITGSSPCGTYVKRMPLLLCLLPCNSNPFCAVSCFQQTAGLSPWLDQSIACLIVLTSSGGPSADTLSKCMKTGDVEGLMSASQMRIVNGLATLVNRTVASCQQAHKQFLRQMDNFSTCANSCRLKGLFSRVEESLTTRKLPEAFLCAHYCVISLQAT